MLSWHSLAAKLPVNYLPLEAYSALPNKSLFRISPDGQKISYRLTSKERDLVVIFDTKKRKVIKGFDVSSINPQNAYFISNNKLILTVERRTKIRGFLGRHDVSTAFVYNISKNKLSQLLTPGKGIYQGQTELGNIIGISDDAKWAYMTAFTLSGEGGVPKNSLMKVNLDKSYKTPRIYEKGTTGAIDYFLNEDKDVIARERYNQETNLHQIEVPDGDSWKVIFQEETPYLSRTFSGLTPDRKSLVMLVNRAGNSGGYYLMSLNDGKITRADFELDNKEIEYTLTDIDRVVYGVQYSGFSPTYRFFEDKAQNMYEEIASELPSSSITLQGMTSARDKIIVFAEWDGLAGDYLSYSNGKLSHLARLRDKVQWEDVNNVIEFSFKARDGLVIPTLLTVPNSAVNSKEKLPAVVLPHGGPESYNQKTFHWLAQYFANRGILVIQPQFRGSTGFGVEYTLKGRGEWGKKMQDDITDSVNKLIKMGEIDPKRVCIVGSSYGGYAALAGATLTPELYKCAISINGISDVPEMLENERDDHGSDSAVLSYWQDVIGNDEIDKAELNKISPINFVNNVKAPVLLIHGTDDKVVNFEQSENMFDALKDANKKVDLVPLKMEGHNLLKPESRLKTLEAIDKFIHQHIGS